MCSKLTDQPKPPQLGYVVYLEFDHAGKLAKTSQISGNSRTSIRIEEPHWTMIAKSGILVGWEFGDVDIYSFGGHRILDALMRLIVHLVLGGERMISVGSLTHPFSPTMAASSLPRTSSLINIHLYINHRVLVLYPGFFGLDLNWKLTTSSLVEIFSRITGMIRKVSIFGLLFGVLKWLNPRRFNWDSALFKRV